MTKAAKNIGLEKLKSTTDLSERRADFNAWQSDLELVTQTVTQTKDIFEPWPKNVNPVPNHVNKALYNLISSRCEASPKAHIQPFHPDGTHAILELQRHYAQLTPETTDKAMRCFE